MKNIYDLVLNNRQLCDLELILNGAFSPLNNFHDFCNYPIK